jgi:hypothetical protein
VATSSVKKPSAPAARQAAISSRRLSVQYTTRWPAACARATKVLCVAINFKFLSGAWLEEARAENMVYDEDSDSDSAGLDGTPFRT